MESLEVKLGEGSNSRQEALFQLIHAFEVWTKFTSDISSPLVNR